MISVFTGILSSSIAASIFFLPIFFISCVFKKIPARLQYYLWIVLLIVAIIPYTLYSDLVISPFPQLHKLASEENIIIRSMSPEKTASDVHAEGLYMNNKVPAEKPSENPSNANGQKKVSLNDVLEVCFYIWITGVIGVLFTYIAANMLFFLKIRKSPVVSNEEIDEIISTLSRDMGIKKPIRIIEMNSVQSPAIYGFYKPVILVKNVEFLRSLSKDKLRLLFMHELQHYKNWDNMVKVIGAFLKALHWFNPLIWYTFHKINVIQEYKCDEEVLEPLEKEAHKQYANLILDVYELLVPVSPFLRKPSFMKLRIKKILSNRSNNPIKLVFEGLMILFLIFFTFQFTNVLAREPVRKLNAAVNDRGADSELYIHSDIAEKEGEVIPPDAQEQQMESIPPEQPVQSRASEESPDGKIEVNFKDKAFEAFVRRRIGKNDGPIYDVDLYNIKQIIIIGKTLVTNENLVLDENFNQVGYTADNGRVYHFSQCDKQGGISSLEDMGLFPGLVTLTIRHNQLKTVAGVERLESIQYLDLSYNYITDLKGLDLLQHEIKYINLSYNRIYDIVPLGGIPPVQDFIDLSHNKIEDIDTLRKIPASYMNLSGNPVIKNSSVVFIPGEGHIIKD